MSSFDFCCCEKKQKPACMYDCDNGYIVEKVKETPPNTTAGVGGGVFVYTEVYV